LRKRERRHEHHGGGQANRAKDAAHGSLSGRLGAGEHKVTRRYRPKAAKLAAAAAHEIGTLANGPSFPI
jgi:hypothetical protein